MNKRVNGFSPLATTITVAIIAVAITSILQSPKVDNNFYNSSVMITNLESNSGGSGTVVFNSDANSAVLTNAHVCHVVENGGLVKGVDHKQFSVSSYKVSKIHDLCLIQVLGNLGNSAGLSKHKPDMFSNATIVGHPQLLPVTVTHGNFSERMELPVAIGYRECTDAERATPPTALFCAFLGKLPVVKTYDAQLISATIMPGSSGSPVFNDKGDISAVVFAGAGDLGYAFAVPFEYVDRFLNQELPTLVAQFPNLVFGDKKESEVRDFNDRIVQACAKAKTKDEKHLCKIVESTIVDFN